MKKVLIALSAASLMIASMVGYAGNVKLVNKYCEPVTFAVSHGPVYNPVMLGTLPPNGWVTRSFCGPFTPDDHFMAYVPNQSGLVVDCGTPNRTVNNIVVRAGFTNTGVFTCRIFEPAKSTCGCPKYKHHHKHSVKQHCPV